MNSRYPIPASPVHQGTAADAAAAPRATYRYVWALATASVGLIAVLLAVARMKAAGALSILHDDLALFVAGSVLLSVGGCAFAWLCGREQERLGIVPTCPECGRETAAAGVVCGSCAGTIERL